jgi:hypothetical protein
MALVMRAILFLLLTLWFSTVQASNLQAIFFQPRKIDMAVPVENWLPIFTLAKAKGFDTLIFQWTSFGDAFQSPENQAWLKARMLEAHSAGLKLVIGLSSDPEIFTHLKQPPAILGSYFRKMNQKNLALAHYWKQNLGSEFISAWYIPLEIDDREWRTEEARAPLRKYLTQQVADLQGVQAIQVYVSSFFAGFMTPENYANMLENLGRQSKVNIWVQDGSGTGKLTIAERELYLSNLRMCKGQEVDGVIYELFRQTEVDQNFAAEPLKPAEMTAVLKQKSPCSKDNVFFALNYLIDFNNPK